MRGITALAVLALVGPVFAQGERMGPRPGPDGRRGAGIEQKLEQILHRLERLEQRVEERDRDHDGRDRDARRDRDRRESDRARRHDRDERSPRRGPARRDGSRRGPRGDMRPGPDWPSPDRFGPDAAPIAQFRRLMQAAQKGDPRARKMLTHMHMAIGKMLAEQKKGQSKEAKHQKANLHKKHKRIAMAGGSKDVKVVRKSPTELKVVYETDNAAGKRREAAIKLMKVEEMRQAKAQGRFEIERRKVEELQRAARIAELRAQAVRLQKEIEMLKRELAK